MDTKKVLKCFQEEQNEESLALVLKAWDESSERIAKGDDVDMGMMT